MRWIFYFCASQKNGMNNNITTTSKIPKTWLSWLLFVALALTWGSSFILIKKGLVAFSWSQVAVLRISFSMLFLSPFIFKHIRLLNWKKDGWAVFAMTMLGNGIPAFLYPIAQTKIDSSLAGILNSMTPLFTLVVSGLFFGIIIKKNKILGVAIGLLGAFLLIAMGENIGAGENNWFALFILAATICYAFSSNIIKNHLSHISPITTSAVAFFMIGPIAITYLFSTDFLSIMQTNEFAKWSLLSVSILSLLGTVLATIVFIRLIQLTSAVFASMVSYLIPVVALLLGFFDGEIITWWHLGGMLLILAGVYLARK